MKENSAMSVSTKIFDRRCGWTRFRMAALIVAASLMVSCSSEKEKEVVPVVTVQAATVASKTIQATIDTDAILYRKGLVDDMCAKKAIAELSR